MTPTSHGGMAFITYASDNRTCSEVSHEREPNTMVHINYYNPPTEDELFINRALAVVNDPMQSAKNISPKRVKRRRNKNKAARKARQRNRNRP